MKKYEVDFKFLKNHCHLCRIYYKCTRKFYDCLCIENSKRECSEENCPLLKNLKEVKEDD